MDNAATAGTATLTHNNKTVPMPEILPEQKELDFGKRYELVIVTKRDKAIDKILQGLSELGIPDKIMQSIMRDIAIGVPEIADHQSIKDK